MSQIDEKMKEIVRSTVRPQIEEMKEFVREAVGPQIKEKMSTLTCAA
jgi:hypothetical protein